MSFSILRKFDKVYPLIHGLYPVDVFANKIRTLLYFMYNRYFLKSPGRFQPPEVLYQSTNFLVVNKPYDVLVNSGEETEYSVATQLKDSFPELVDETCVHHFRFTHRLDFATSGILVLALNKKAAAYMQKQFVKRKVWKHYLALVGGYLSEPYILVDVPIGKDSLITHKHKMCTVFSEGCTDIRDAVTLVILLEQGLYNGAPASKVLLVPYTGRTHQLRVHCNIIGHTIIGDYTYSNGKDSIPHRMMLHAYGLGAPSLKEPLNILSPDPFTSQADAKWKPHKVFITYNDVIKEDLSLDSIRLKQTSGYCTISVKTDENKQDIT